MVVLAILFPLVAFLFPLTIYLFVLGLINRRRGPLLVSGPWDFAGVLFAASGFLLVVGPSILAGMGDRWRVVRLAGQIRAGHAPAGMCQWQCIPARATSDVDETG